MADGLRPSAKQVVIGIGDAGLNIVETLSQVIEEDGYDADDFLLLGINSHDIDSDVIDDRWLIEVQDSGKDWSTKQDEYYYLDRTDQSPTSDGGVQRNRPTARGHFDESSNVNTLIANFDQYFQDFLGDSTNVNVWLVNSLGGGTGSGTMPMILGLLQALEGNIVDDMTLFGLSTVPRLDVAPNENHMMGLDADAIPNAFGALSELRELLDVKAVTDPPELEIDLELDDENVELVRGTGSLPFDRGKIRAFHLLGVDEDKINVDAEDNPYAEQVERTAAYTILTGAVDDENYPHDEYPDLRDRKLNTVDAVQYSFPWSKVAEYVETEANLQRDRKERAALNDLSEEFKALKETVGSVSEVRPESGDIDKEDLRRLVSYAEDQAEAVTGLEYLTSEENLRDSATDSVSPTDDKISFLKEDFKLDDLLSPISRAESKPGTIPEVVVTSDDTNDDGELVADINAPDRQASLLLKYLFYVELEDRLESEIFEAAQDYEDNLNDIWQEVVEDAGEQTQEEYDNADNPAEKWGVAESLVDDVIDNERNPGLLRRGDEERANRLEEMQQVVNGAEDTYQSLEKVADELMTLRRNTHDRLRDLLEWYDSEREDIEDTIRNLDATIETTEQTTLVNLKSDLKESEVSKFSTLPITNPENIITNHFTTSEDDVHTRIPKLVAEYDLDDAENPTREAIIQHLQGELTIQQATRDNVIEQSELVDGLRDLLGRLEERFANDGAIDRSMVVPMSHENDDWKEATGYSSYGSLLTDEAAKMEVSEIGKLEVGTPGTVRFVFVNVDVTMDDASEYATIREWYQTGQLSGKLNVDQNDPADIINFAYPRLSDLDVDEKSAGSMKQVDKTE
ncbi:tubulin-like doman-containing protein [Haloplanus sp. C73]|uniref:tubulin-like doman-containing protein n=1 Tax=Haloplanus sp. C73 TaxID=3421641 RepID=UPI003EB98D04